MNSMAPGPRVRKSRSHQPDGVELATTGKPLFEPRLWGTWKSDRKKTFEHFQFSKKGDPKQQRKFQLLFGKLVHKWSRTRVSTYFDCDRHMGYPNDRTPEVQEYRVVARDPGCVVIYEGRRVRNRKSGLSKGGYDILEGLQLEHPLRTIYFDDEDCYRISLGSMHEYFRRIE
jgi:hypothetical protein